MERTEWGSFHSLTGTAERLGQWGKPCRGGLLFWGLPHLQTLEAVEAKWAGAVVVDVGG